MRIFLSYGHDEYKALAEKLRSDLEAENFEVFMDNNPTLGMLNPSDDWEYKLEKGIEDSSWIVLMMTEYSVRRPDGFCLNEISYARTVGKAVLPVMVQRVNPPLSIARIQYIDMENLFEPKKGEIKEELYNAKKNEVVEILKGLKELSYEGIQNSISSKLNPIDNDVYSDRYRKNFYGRKKLFDLCHEWMMSDKQILWITGDAGTGKTAFIAELTQREKDIAAVHFCRYNDNERADPKRAIMSLSYYLATQVPEYKAYLGSILQDSERLVEKNATRLFEYLFIEPFSKIKHRDKPVVLVIDALDEAVSINGKNELLEVLASDFKRLPGWIKLIVTSRNVPKIRQRFSKEENIDITNDSWEDIEGFVRENLKSELSKRTNANSIVNRIVRNSDGIFLYAKLIIDDIKDGDIKLESIEDFPIGLSGIYCDYFDRILSTHPELDYKTEIRPILNLLCTSYAPLDIETLCEVSEMDDDDFDDCIEALRDLFPQRNSSIEPIHKSIYDWLSDREKSGGYHINKRKGHNSFSNYFYDIYKLNRYTGNDAKSQYTIKYLSKHLISSKKYNLAIETLSDDIFQNRRIKELGLDSSIRSYLSEIAELNTVDPISAISVLRSEGFISIFTKNRKFFYNSGLYFSIRECGFDEAIDAAFYDDLKTETQIGVINYRYITEQFDETIKLINNISLEYLPIEYQSEIHNILALCYRKQVDFAESNKHFNLAFHLGEGQESFYDQSISLVNLGKNSYHQLNWEESYKWTEKAILYLTKEFKLANENKDSDYSTTLELFIAEYHRLYAESLIWDYQIERTKEELSLAEEIYSRVVTRDRYYPRFLYTTAFSHLLSGDYQKVLDECNDILPIMTSTYDKSQVLFYKGIALLIMNDFENLRDAIDEAAGYALKIGAWLEYEEIVLLERLAFVETYHDHCAQYNNNENIRNWLIHVKDFIEQIAKHRSKEECGN